MQLYSTHWGVVIWSFWRIIREVVKNKTRLFMVRLAVRVDPHRPPLFQSAKKNQDLWLWMYMAWNKFWQNEIFLTIFDHLGLFISRCFPNRETRICQKVMTNSAWKGHFSAPSQWHKIRFEYQGIIFNGKKGPKFSHMLMVRLGAWPPPYGQADRRIWVFFTTSLRERCVKKNRKKLTNVSLVCMYVGRKSEMSVFFLFFSQQK